MRRTITRQKGLTLVETLIVLGILLFIVTGFLVAQSRELERKKARFAGEQISLIGSAMDAYIVNNYGTLAATTITNIAAGATNGPLTCYAGGAGAYSCVITMTTLEQWGYLPNWTTSTSPYGSNYKIVLQRNMASGVAQISGVVVTALPLTIGTGAVRYDLLGDSMTAAGARSGIVPATTTTAMSGFGGAYQVNNSYFASLPAASVPFSASGQFGYYTGFDTEQYSGFVRRDGSLFMTGDLDFGERDIVNVRGINGSELNPGQSDPRGNPISVLRMGQVIVSGTASSFPAYGSAYTPQLITGPNVPTDLYGRTSVYDPAAGNALIARTDSNGIDLRYSLFNTTQAAANTYADTTANPMVQVASALDVRGGITNRAGSLYLTSGTKKVGINADVTVGQDGSATDTAHNLTVNGAVKVKNPADPNNLNNLTSAPTSTTPGVIAANDIFLSNNQINNNPSTDPNGQPVGNSAAGNLQLVPLSYLTSRLVLKEVYKIYVPSVTNAASGKTALTLIPKPNCHADILPTGVNAKALVFVYPVQESIQGPVLTNVPSGGASPAYGNMSTFFEAIAQGNNTAVASGGSLQNSAWAVNFDTNSYDPISNSYVSQTYPRNYIGPSPAAATNNNFPPTDITAFAQTYCSYY